MASNSESGIAKNAANFDELISCVNGYGTKYNPSQGAIQLVALQALSDKTKDAIDLVDGASVNYSKAIEARANVFDPLSTFCTRVMNALVATDASPKVEESVRSLVKKIQGTRSTAKKSAEEKEAAAIQGKSTKEISTSQMSFDSRLANFKKLIKLLESVDAYARNEAELAIAGLKTYYDSLAAKNKEAVDTTSPLSNARIARNELFNADKIGMVAVTKDVKAYVKSVYGASSPQYKQVSKLQFKKIKA